MKIGKKDRPNGQAPRTARTFPAGPALSKRQQVASALLKGIQERSLAEEQRLPSEAELVRRFQVCRCTVRQAIQDLVRQGVVVSRPGYGHLVRSRKAERVIGFVSGRPFATIPYDQLAMEALHRELAAKGCGLRVYLTRLGSAGHEKDREQLMRDVRTGLLSGVITEAWPCPHREDPRAARLDADLLALFRSSQIPCVPMTAVDLPGAIRHDYRSVGYLGTRYFLERGVRRIALAIHEAKDLFWEQGVVAAYRQALAEQGLRERKEWICRFEMVPEAGGYHGFKRWWPKSGQPDAMVIADDTMCRGVMLAAVEMKVDIPRQLQIASLAIKGSPMLFPFPFVRLEFDPAADMAVVAQRLFEVMAHPGQTPPPLDIQPVVVAPDGAPLPAGKPSQPPS